jgi:hypothetical protein
MLAQHDAKCIAEIVLLDASGQVIDSLSTTLGTAATNEGAGAGKTTPAPFSAPTDLTATLNRDCRKCA